MPRPASHSIVFSSIASCSYVDGVLDLVELRPLAHAMVGEPGGGGVGLSLEQRKRLSIAVELVASPAVLFLE